MWLILMLLVSRSIFNGVGGTILDRLTATSPPRKTSSLSKFGEILYVFGRIFFFLTNRYA
jgi:hypothetical protein